MPELSPSKPLDPPASSGSPHHYASIIPRSDKQRLNQNLLLEQGLVLDLAHGTLSDSSALLQTRSYHPHRLGGHWHNSSRHYESSTDAWRMLTQSVGLLQEIPPDRVNTWQRSRVGRCSKRRAWSLCRAGINGNKLLIYTPLVPFQALLEGE